MTARDDYPFLATPIVADWFELVLAMLDEIERLRNVVQLATALNDSHRRELWQLLSNTLNALAVDAEPS